jgi:hypothetical protein
MGAAADATTTATRLNGQGEELRPAAHLQDVEADVAVRVHVRVEARSRKLYVRWRVPFSSSSFVVHRAGRAGWTRYALGALVARLALPADGTHG